MVLVSVITNTYIERLGLALQLVPWPVAVVCDCAGMNLKMLEIFARELKDWTTVVPACVGRVSPC